MVEKFTFISDLSESRLIPNRLSLKKRAPKEIAELAYLHILTLNILLSEEDSEIFAKSFCRKTCRGGNFRHWRSDGTDLYTLLYALSEQDSEMKGDERDADYYRTAISIYPAMIYRWIRDGGDEIQRHEETQRLFARLDTMFRISDSSMRAIRRLVQDWPKLKKHDCRLAMTRLLQFMRSMARNSELLPHLERLSATNNFEIRDANNPEAGHLHVHNHGAPKHDFLKSLSIQRENASAGATSSASVAAVIGGIGAGFDNDYSKSVYPPPKRTKRPAIIRRQPTS